MLGRPAHQEQHDARLCSTERRIARRRIIGFGCHSEEVGEIQPGTEKTLAADPHELAAAPSVAQTHARTERMQHRRFTFRAKPETRDSC
jgi:hypothetical protein